MSNIPANEDLRVFLHVARLSSFAAAAEELRVSTAYVSKRLRVLEGVLGVRLLHRTTRRVSVTREGERVFLWAQRVLDNVDQLMQEVAATRAVPRGLLRVSCSFGFGRNVVGPMLSRLVERFPALQVRLEVFDRLVDVASEGFDLDVRVGDDIAPHLIARRLADNHRLLCAAPDYLARRGTPRTPEELAGHDCLVIKERDHPFGVWTLRAGAENRTIKVTGPLSANNGEIAVCWAVDGRGIVLRSHWDVAPLLRDGLLVPLLAPWRQDANIWAVYPSRLENSAKVRVAVEFLQEEFRRFAAQAGG
ncbi:LysR family transcriptional regulator [Bordetella bronchiseptica]|uniref:LysR family transcriptional regulator n=1 Tax=Bordetella bronchiseptica TaxID=518 RepID=UPI000444E984|nr:LysR family transcriptional regulator [Bordetella bronchiseptica]AWP86673.1 LysR family transcriptional regulator [Bordetella bronchiseptica]AWQ12244.1 LysR family transcriptional regulator [Bordetella bronchiseptica]AXT87415.1 LysR family transcriptional regulator [Bordetella bronchiseptica]KDB79816.1 transcriptional regulator YeaT [Bordetella bronchiseptica CARE970018BB]KDC96232.1 transcriptional regulator YeaT [Bordetella bronchiseptica MBORD670]